MAITTAGCSLDLSRPYQGEKNTVAKDFGISDFAQPVDWPVADSALTDGNQGSEGTMAEDGSASDGNDRDGSKPLEDGSPPDAVWPADTLAPDTLVPDTLAPDVLPPGKWYQANSKVCSTFCGTLAKKNIAGPEGGHCTSGERLSPSAKAQGIKYVYGCWGCVPMTSYTAVSVGGYCYGPGQKRDNDGSDRTVGCFCR